MSYFRRGFSRRGYSGYGRGYRRWYGRRGWTRSWRGSVNRRIQSGTRTFSCTIPVENIFTLIVDANSFNTHVYCSSPWEYYPSAAEADYAQASLMMSELYRTYSQLYDEVKVDWVSYELTILDVIGQGGEYSAARIWTTVDRKFTSGDMASPMNYYQVRTSSGAQGTMLTNNSRSITRRYIAARDIQERTVWHDCSLTATGNPLSRVYDSAWYNAGSNLLFFSPSLWYFLELSSAPSSQKGISVSLKVKYGVTFRNAKYGLSSSGAGGGPQKSVVDREPVKIEVLPDVEEDEMADGESTQKVEDDKVEKEKEDVK